MAHELRVGNPSVHAELHKKEPLINSAVLYGAFDSRLKQSWWRLCNPTNLPKSKNFTGQGRSEYRPGDFAPGLPLLRWKRLAASCRNRPPECGYRARHTVTARWPRFARD